MVGLEKIYFTVLNPDPHEFFHRRYGMYPCFELEKADFPEKYIEALNKPYGNQVGEDLGTIRWGVHVYVAHLSLVRSYSAIK